MIHTIVAFAPDKHGNFVIGSGNTIPWSLPEDLAWFRKHTENQSILMGRKTFESLPRKPLPNRQSFVLTRDPNWTHPGVIVINNPLQIIEKYYFSPEKIFICGGADIYTLFVPWSQKIIVTRINHLVEGNVFWPYSDEYLQKTRTRHYVERNSKSVDPAKWNGSTNLTWTYEFYDQAIGNDN